MREQLLEYLFKKSPVALSYHKVIFDENGFPYDCEFLDVNNIYENLLGLKDYIAIGKKYNDIFDEDNVMGTKFKKAFQDAIINNKTGVMDFYNESIKRWIRITIFILDDSHFACMYTDVTKEHVQENEIEGILMVNINILCVMDEYLNFIKVNKEFEKVLGYKTDEVVNKSFLSLVHDDDLPKTITIIKGLNEIDAISGFTNRVKLKDSTYRYLEWYIQVNNQYVYASARDVTEKFQHEMRTNKSLLIDELTGLLNIGFFNRRVLEEMERADRYNDALSITIFTLDNYLTDTIRYAVKDNIIKEIARLVKDVIRRYDVLARIDNQKFILLMPKTNINGAAIVAEKIKKALSDNIHADSGELITSLVVSERVKGELLEHWKERLINILEDIRKKGESSIVVAEIEENREFKRENIKWKDEWNSGNTEIDNQHKELVELLDKFIAVSFKENDISKTKNELDTLTKSLVYHFDYEEEILASVGYEYHDRHSKIHKNLIGKMFQLKEGYENGEINAYAFIAFLENDVIIGHMINEDKQFFNKI